MKKHHYQQNNNNNTTNFLRQELNKLSFERKLQKTISNLKAAESCFPQSVLAEDNSLVPKSVSTATYQQGHTLHTLLCGAACPSPANKQQSTFSADTAMEGGDKFLQENMRDNDGIEFYCNLNKRQHQTTTMAESSSSTIQQPMQRTPFGQWNLSPLLEHNGGPSPSSARRKLHFLSDTEQEICGSSKLASTTQNCRLFGAHEEAISNEQNNEDDLCVANSLKFLNLTQDDIAEKSGFLDMYLSAYRDEQKQSHQEQEQSSGSSKNEHVTDGEENFESAFEESFESEERQKREKQQQKNSTPTKSTKSKFFTPNATLNPFKRFAINEDSGAEKTSKFMLEEEDEETTLMLNLNSDPQNSGTTSKVVAATTNEHKTTTTITGAPFDVLELRKSVNELKSGLNCMSDKLEMVVDQLDRTLSDSRVSEENAGLSSANEQQQHIDFLDVHHHQHNHYLTLSVKNDQTQTPDSWRLQSPKQMKTAAVDDKPGTCATTTFAQKETKRKSYAHGLHSECKFLLKQRIEALREFFRIRLFVLREEQLNAASRDQRHEYSAKYKELMVEFDAEKRKIKQELRAVNVDKEIFIKHTIELAQTQNETLRLNARLHKMKHLMMDHKRNKQLEPIRSSSPPQQASSGSQILSLTIIAPSKPELALDLSVLNEPEELPYKVPPFDFDLSALQGVEDIDVEQKQEKPVWQPENIGVDGAMETPINENHEECVDEEQNLQIEKEQPVQENIDQTAGDDGHTIDQQIPQHVDDMKEESSALVGVERLSLNGNGTNDSNNSSILEEIATESCTHTSFDEFNANKFQQQNEEEPGRHNENDVEQCEIEVVSAREQSHRTESSRQRTSAEIESIPEEIPSLRDENSSSIFSSLSQTSTSQAQQQQQVLDKAENAEDISTANTEFSNRQMDSKQGEEEDAKLANVLLAHPFVQSRKFDAENGDDEENNEEENSEAMSAAIFQPSEKSLQSILSSTHSFCASGRDSMSRRRSSASEALLKLRMMNNVPNLGQPETKESPRTPRSPLAIDRFNAKYPHQSTSREASFNEENGLNAAGTDTAREDESVELLDELPNTSKLGMLLDVSQSPRTAELLLNSEKCLETPPTPTTAERSAITMQQQQKQQQKEDANARMEEIAVDPTKKFAHYQMLIDECVPVLWAEFEQKGDDIDAYYPDDEDDDDEEIALDAENQPNNHENARDDGDAYMSDSMIRQLCAEFLYILVQKAHSSSVARHTLSSQELLAEHFREQIIGPLVDQEKREAMICSKGARQRAAQTSHVLLDTNRFLLAEDVYGTLAQWPPIELLQEADRCIIEEFLKLHDEEENKNNIDENAA